MAFEKSDISIVAYGLYLTCVTFIALTIHVQHAYGLFAMKCITFVFRYEYLTFQTQVKFNKQYVFGCKY